MKRGCISDNENYEKCKESTDSCRICDHKNGCNNLALYQTPKLSYSLCDKSAQCAWYQPRDTIKKCRHEFLNFLNETCATYFDKDENEAERDCTFDKGDCDDGVNCYKCSTSGCNVKNVITQTCYQCSSLIPDETECSNIVKGLKSKKCDAEIQFFNRRGCYTLRKNDNSVIRGCAYDINLKDLELCENDDNNTCSYCSGMDSSEAKVKCFKCDSSIKTECVEKGDDTVECEEENQKCYTEITDKGHTVRGCTNKTEFQIGETCDGFLCNNGHYPKNRLQCYICNGTDCVKKPETGLKACPIYKKDDKCFIQVIDETDTVRDCLSSVDSLPNYSVTCPTSGCNDNSSTIEVSCLQCNSDIDINCKSLKTETIIDKFNILLGRNDPTCFTYHKFDKVIRGSHRDSGMLELEYDFYKSCCGSECNNNTIQVPKCVICGPNTKDPNCIKNLYKTCSEIDSSCHACINDNTHVYQRGCGKKPNQNELSCYQCQENGCNIKPFKKCFKCNSKTDPSCAGPLDITAIKTEICEMSDSQCLTAIDAYGNTERGCLSESFNGINKTKYVKCDDNLCNNNRFPDNRLQCFRCNGDEHCGIKQKNEWAESCNIYNDIDLCFEFINVNKQIYRGCTSDPEYKNCSKPGVRCHSCPENNCNNEFFNLKAPELTCFACNELDKECNWSQTNNQTLKLCKKILPLEAIEKCYTYNSEDDKIQRGCLLDDKICTKEENKNKCSICNNEGCNNNLVTPEKCLQMNIETYKSLAFERTLCKAKTQKYEKRGCYVQWKENILNFGCITDLSEDEYNNCKNNPKSCNTCTDDECDKLKAPERDGKKPTLNCYKCSGKDVNCQWKQNVYTVKCENPIPEGKNETCFTRKDSDGNIERGCSYDSNKCLNPKDEFCDTCEKSECNSKLLIPQECIQEKYKINEKKETDLKKSSCTNPEQYWETRGCYVKRDDNDISWGCTVDLSKEDFKECTANVKKCNYCIDEACNDMKMPNSASKLVGISITLLFSIIIKFFLN